MSPVVTELLYAQPCQTEQTSQRLPETVMQEIGMKGGKSVKNKKSKKSKK